MGKNQKRNDLRDFFERRPLPVISLFSGSGGLDIGFERAGFIPIFALDLSSAACITFKANHPSAHVVRADLSKKTPRYIAERLKELPEDVHPVGVIGGPPCQAFSLGNGYKRDDDPRAQLPAKYAEILKGLN
ncbi:MAG: DNA cytosine methyltransferase, partial [Acidobacteria bacterium]|nr:DNA cytosine methyltransferase [Acidobacteriota bacterium]